METQRTRDKLTGDFYDEPEKMPGLGRWCSRNVWLLVRLFIVMVFTFGTSLIADQFSYGLQGTPTRITTEQINDGLLPEGLRNGDYVEIVGTPDVGDDLTPENIGTEESRIGIASRYSVSYFYFRLEETGDNLLIQNGNQLPVERFDGESYTWDGKLANLGTVIFHDTTQAGLERADLPLNESIPVVEVGETPEAYRNLFPAYSVIVGVWIVSLLWLLWKRNTPFI